MAVLYAVVLLPRNCISPSGNSLRFLELLKTLGVGGLDRFGGQPALALFCSYHCVISGKWREGGEILPNSGKFDSCVDKTQSWILKVTASLSLLCQHPCDLLSPGTQPRVNSGRPPASHGSFRGSWGTRGTLVTQTGRLSCFLQPCVHQLVLVSRV